MRSRPPFGIANWRSAPGATPPRRIEMRTVPCFRTALLLALSASSLFGQQVFANPPRRPPVKPRTQPPKPGAQQPQGTPQPQLAPQPPGTAPPAAEQPKAAPTTRPVIPPSPPGTVPGGLNLQGASLVEVIDILARALKINYILDPRVKGAV